MKVCHVTSAHSRYDGRIFLKQLVSLTKEYDCYLICCDDKDDEVKNNVKIISTHKKFKNRYERFFLATKVLKKKCLEVDADVYQFHDSELLDLALYMKKRGKKVIFDSHEDFEALFLERQWIPYFLRKALQKIYVKKERKVLPKLDLLICAAEHIKNKFLIYNKNSVVIENFPILVSNPIKKKVKKDYICFAGNIDSTWNHDVVINSISNIDNIEYLIAGAYPTNFFDSFKELNGFSKISLLGKIPPEELRKLYQKSKIGLALCSYRPNVNYKEGSLGITKIFEYMMYSLPVIFTDFTVFKNINKKSQFGISVNPYNVEEVKNAINQILDNPDLAKKMGENGRKLVEKNYNWNILEKKLLKVYKTLE